MQHITVSSHCTTFWCAIWAQGWSYRTQGPHGVYLGDVSYPGSLHPAAVLVAYRRDHAKPVFPAYRNCLGEDELMVVLDDHGRRWLPGVGVIADHDDVREERERRLGMLALLN